ncbi:MAG: hypothetical protein QOJ13_2799 [Gaiellales bacterium]|jgi:hypothetical protein|nr:hypothetical protein [Gaiellales bacterium]
MGPIEIITDLMGRPLTETEAELVRTTINLVLGRQQLQEADRAQMQTDAEMLGRPS